MSRTKPRHILVPVDLSEASRAGLRFADDLSRRFDARITVVHVETATTGLAEVMASTGALAASGDAAARHLERVQAEVETFVADTVASGWPVIVVEGLFVAETIVREVLDRNADWICMSAAGKKGWRRFILGSVTAEVVRGSPVPVLTYRSRKGEQGELVLDDFRRVLVATDLGEGSAALVQMGAALAEHGSLTLLHVIEAPPEYGLYGVPLTIPAESLEAAREWTEGALDRLSRDVPRSVLKPFTTLAGRPLERILHEENEIQPDVTVISTHGRHGVDRLMLGSVAERVVRRATGPVLVVPLETGVRTEGFATCRAPPGPAGE